MSLLRRLFGRPEAASYQQGVELYEAGRFAEAIVVLREAARDGTDTPTGSLISFHFRQALVSEGRRLLRSGQAQSALPLLREAAEVWSHFADLQFLYGAALGQVGNWSDAVTAAQVALRQNPDYCEARLLEACALAELIRPREAADSLNKLLESGRRHEHALVSVLARAGGYAEDLIPPDLQDHLVAAVRGEDPDGEVAAAVALCRAGDWQNGIARLRSLTERYPKYADYRVKLAAALYQVGEVPEAAEEVEVALVLNPHYRTATILKALILANQQQLVAAFRVVDGLQTATPESRPRGHEELFVSYLAATLELLTGRPAAVIERLAPWGDLVHTFPRAELLRAAAAFLAGRLGLARQILAALSDNWSADADYQFSYACFLLQIGDLAGMEKVLAGWPRGQSLDTDARPLLLEAQVALARQRPPVIPESNPHDPYAAAWRFLQARWQAEQSAWGACWELLTAESDVVEVTEPEGKLLVWAATNLVGETVPADQVGPDVDWTPPPTAAAGVIPVRCYLAYRSGQTEPVLRLLARHSALHPEDPRWSWLSLEFWLDPVRRWIG
ncbi:MAG: tetratricopeptide repeat protein [bacterium]